MDKVKLARKPIRGLLTRTCNEIDDLLKVEFVDSIQLRSKGSKLDDLLEKIQKYDEEILDIYLNEGNEVGYEAEILAIDQYNSEANIMKIRIEDVLQKNVNNERVLSEHSTTASSKHTSKRKFKLPKIELKKFSGKLIDWLSWWSQFEKIHNDDELHTTDKFEYLRQAMEVNTRAKEIVEGYPATEDNYPKVITALQERFGKKKLLIQIYVRELFLMGLKNMNREVTVSSLFDKLVSHVRSLESLGITLEQATLFLYPMVESSLPEDIYIAWQRSPLYERDGSSEVPPKNELDYLLQFLQYEVEREEQRNLVRESFSPKNKQDEETKTANLKKENKKKEQVISSAANLFNAQVKSVSCIFCKKPHESKDCAATEFWTMDELKNKIKENKMCFQCLKPNHNARSCKSFVKCHVCSKRHFTIMCPDLKLKKQSKTDSINLSTAANFDCAQDVLLKTIMVFVNFGANRKVARVLLDDGSQRSYITSRLTKSIKSEPLNFEYIRNILFDGRRTEIQKVNNHKVVIEDLNKTNAFPLILRERSILGGRVTRIPRGLWLEELKNKKIKVNDVVMNKHSLSDIDVVIGSDYWGTIVTGRKETLSCGLTAYETIWGWTLSGVIPKVTETNNIISMFIAVEEVNKLWSLDVIGIKDPIEKLTEIQEEVAAKRIFRENLKRNEDGRYKVKLPWIDDIPNISSNKSVATSRLISATKRLNLNLQFKNYDDVFKSWIDEGYIELVNEEENGKGHYLPHHPVFKDSITTPVRPVFDASCKTPQHYSLNDCLYKGPNYIESLPAKLIRFRMKPVGVLADIRKAFQMIEIDENDKEYLKFLWWRDNTQTQMITYRHCRVVFGLKCSPFLLAAVLEEHLSAVENSKRWAAEELKSALYIDNCVTSMNSHEDYEEFKRTAMEIMSEGKFELRQWECSLPLNLNAISLPMETKVLGMVWEKRMDTLKIQIPKLDNTKALTKRNIASTLHTFFDPLGIISPALITPKIMLQQAWKKKISWDSELPSAWKEQFEKWCMEIEAFDEIKIPRLCRIKNSTNHQLHTFTDASKNAYSAIVFLRSECEGKVEVQIIQSKSRVSPIAKATIPRLELLGCLIGSRLSQSSIEAMDLHDIQKFYWSDSTTAIAWIQRNSQWGTFVNNRVKRIREVTEMSEWRYVPGILNPADLPSRGCSPKELLHSRWWEGPDWLKLSSDKWPNNIIEFDEEEVNNEMKKKATTTMFSADEKEDPEDLEPLTPAMFLRGTKNTSFPEKEEISSRTLQKEWERIQDLKNRIQSRFRREYIGHLVEHKKCNQSSTINIGDIVLVEDGNKKRYLWPMGRILEVMTSSDGIARVARIKTKNGCINRPLQRLYPLEMSQSSSKPEICKDILNERNPRNETTEELTDERTTRSGRVIKRPKIYDYWK